MSEKIELEGRVMRATGTTLELRLTTAFCWPGQVFAGQRYHVTLEPVEPELLPCPHCGGEAEWYDWCGPVEEHNYQVMCKSCGVRTSRFRNQLSAIAAWNRRAS